MSEVAVITTDHGDLVIELWNDVAPETVANFTKLANEGFYDGTAFHRIVKDFMVQGGDPLSKDADAVDRWGTGDPGYKIKAEFSDKPHVRGVISMARSQNPDSAGSQFFVCLKEANFLDGQYTCFGTLVGGDDVLVTLGDLETERAGGGEKSRPVKRCGVTSIKVVSREEAGV